MTPTDAPPDIDYVTLDATLGGDQLTVIASYQYLDGHEVVELVEAVDEWGMDHLKLLWPHEYEHLRLTALSLFHERTPWPPSKP